MSSADSSSGTYFGNFAAGRIANNEMPPTIKNVARIARSRASSLIATISYTCTGVAEVVPSQHDVLRPSSTYPRPFWAPPRRSPSRPASWWSAAASIQSFPRPVGGKPVRDDSGERPVEICPIGPHPGLDRHVIFLGGGRVKIDASDDVVVDWVEDGEGEPDAAREMDGVAA